MGLTPASRDRSTARCTTHTHQALLHPLNTIFRFENTGQVRGAADYLDADLGTILINFLHLTGQFLGKNAIRKDTWFLSKKHMKTPITYDEHMQTCMPTLKLELDKKIVFKNYYAIR